MSRQLALASIIALAASVACALIAPGMAAGRAAAPYRLLAMAPYASAILR